MSYQHAREGILTTIFIRQLWVYSVKSLGGVSVARATITAGGSLELEPSTIPASFGTYCTAEGSRLSVGPEATI